MSAARPPLALEAPAKVNLELRVVGRRADGFHLLESTFVLLELADRLVLRASGAPRLEVSGAAALEVPTDRTNLAWRGLEAALGPEPALALQLEKRIPSAAGLGGGSSDAAAAWRLGRAWMGQPDTASDTDLDALARVGADVPFFAAGVPAASVSGIGERVTPIEGRPAFFVLAHVPARVSTAAVFAELSQSEWGSAPNDLMAPASRICPAIGDAMALVAAAGGEPRLTGSGSTVFTVTDDPERARRVAERIRRGGLAVTETRARLDAASISPMDEEA